MEYYELIPNNPFQEVERTFDELLNKAKDNKVIDQEKISFIIFATSQ